MKLRIHRHLWPALVVSAGLVAGCQRHLPTTQLGSGDIRSVFNLLGTNAVALDVAFDPTREGITLGALQSGVADYGRGEVGRPTSEPPVLVVTRHTSDLSAFWSTVITADFTAAAQPAMAATTEGDTVVAIGDFAGSIGAASGSLVELMSVADGSARWSVSLPPADAPRPLAVVTEPDGVIVVASALGTGAVQLDRLSQVDGSVLTSRPLGTAVGNHQLMNLAVDTDGNLLATGSFDGSLTLAATYVAIAGQHDAYVTKVGRDSGNALWSRPLRLRDADDRVVVAPLSGGDLGVVGVFAFADDVADTANPLGPTFYLRAARLSGATGETVWTTRTELPNTASLEIVDLADGAENLILLATFSGTLQFGSLTAVSTTPSAMAMMDFAADGGTSSWLRYSSNVATRGSRIGQDLSQDAIGIGTFTAQDAEGSDIATIFAVRVLP